MAHTHSHTHPPAAGPGPDRSGHSKALRTAFGLTATYTVVEIVGGLLTGSLALLADAVHMLSDNVSLGLALIAIGLASRPPTPQRSFGYQRAEILAALANGVALIAVSIWILYEAYQRLDAPEEVAGVGMLAIASVGAVVNIVSARILAKGSGESLNMTGALRHVLSDLAGPVGAIVAAIVIITSGFDEADAIIGALIALLVAASAIPIIRESVQILLEEAPEGLDATEIGETMAAADGVVEVHDLHVWTITSGFPALSAHVVVGAEEDCHARRRELEALLHDRFDLGHTTLQMDHQGARELLQVSGVDSEQEPGD
jgi:cobalt-zinc-cadmium efflux system protein